MDPLSITASAVAFIGVCRKISQQLKLLRDLRRAPESISHVCDEIENLQNVLAAVHIAATKRQNDSITGTWISVMRNVETILDELTSLCGEAALKVGQAKSARRSFLARYKWLTEKGRVEEIKSRLQTSRLDLANQLAATSLHDILDLNGGVKSVLSILNDWCQTQSGRAETGSIQNVEHKANRQIALDVTSRMVVKASQKPVPLSDPAERQRTSSKAFECMSKCSCACHQQVRFKSPSYFNQYLGSLLVKSSGLPGLRWTCDEIKCKQRSQRTIKIAYRFPEWFLNRMVSTMILTDQLSGPRCSLVVPRLVRDESDIFYFSRNGDLAGIKRLFSDGIASPFDTSSSWNFTALHYAVEHGQIDTAQFLIKAGAHTDVTAANEETPADLAWNKICTRTLPSTKSESFALMFEKETWFEDRHLSTLHKIVLNLLPQTRNLRSELEVSTKDINATDSFKRTPLSWAAELGDEEHVQALLEHGADHAIASVVGNNPLHYAAQAAQPGCMRLLLDYGADVSARNEWYQHALNITCFFTDDTAYAQVLLHAGADINEQDTNDSSALSSAAFTNRPLMLTYLLERGADINNTGADVCSPLDDAVVANSHECISILLRNGAKLTSQNMFNITTLHRVAERADTWTMELFASLAGNLQLDDTIKDHNDKTPRDLLEARSDEVTPYMRQLFDKITAKRVEEDPVDEEEVFYDMLEDLAPPLGLVDVAG